MRGRETEEMLEKLLQTLRAGGTRTVAELARELETSVPLVELMVEELARLGYLARAGGAASSAGSESCSEHCSRCQMSGGCILGTQTGVWTLTDRAWKV